LMLDGFGFEWMMVRVFLCYPRIELTVKVRLPEKLRPHSLPCQVAGYLSVWMLSSRTIRIPSSLEQVLFCACKLDTVLVIPPNLLYPHSRSEDNENYEASRYSSADISAVLELSHEDLIFIAVLAGGDYSVRGIISLLAN
jgi:hypothetical protein